MQTRREFLAAAAATAAGLTLPASIARALSIPANRRTGTLQDVEHIVVLTQENRSFDHYFGTLPGVRGFGDPFPIPVPDKAGIPGIRGKTVWFQPTLDLLHPVIAPFHLNTTQHFEYMRVEGTPHGWPDAQLAWDQGVMAAWPLAKANHSLGYFREEDIPFQWALANAFTVCDAYHCAVHAGTNTNRLFLWTGTNDPLARGNGPATYNDYDNFDADIGGNGGYAWTTYPERLEAAGVSWQVYEDMGDNFTDNPLAGFKVFRDAWFQRPGYSQALRDRGVSTRDLDQLAADVLAGTLPQVSWIVATAEGSEHPGPSSPAQGAAYTARVLDCLTANPEVWAKTVLLVNFDENDGFFDHVPPPAPPSHGAGISTVDTTGEYHEVLVPYHAGPAERVFQHRPYGLGPRVPLYAVSPWSKGGWVSSEVYDHTSILRFIAARFGVDEPNISPWRRAVCGDLTAAFDFARPDDAAVPLPDTAARAAEARALPGHTTPPTPSSISLPVQGMGARPSRALPYALTADARVLPGGFVQLRLANAGAAAVLHVYDRRHAASTPYRYTLGAGAALAAEIPADAQGEYDLWLLGPNGFHRHARGSTRAAGAEAEAAPAADGQSLRLTLRNDGDAPLSFVVTPLRYGGEPVTQFVAARSTQALDLPLAAAPWYDAAVTVAGLAGFGRRFAGRIETGAPSTSDPAMGGPAVAAPWQP